MSNLRERYLIKYPSIAAWFIMALLTCILCRPALGASQPAKLKADEVTLNYEAQTMIALGNASLTYQDLSITAGRIDVDLKLNVLNATGHVVLTEEGRSLNTEQLYYDLNKKDAKLGSFQGNFDDLGIDGTIYLQGEGLEQKNDNIIATGISVTTCSLEEPHYHFSAGEIDYYPGDRLILRHVYYWEGHVKLLYLPYLAISLKDRQNSFAFPRLGYSTEEGLYLKLAYNFYVGDNQSGAVLLDLMQRKGIGEGLKYNWDLENGIDFEALMYHLDNQLTGGDDYHLQAKLLWPLDTMLIQGNLALADLSLDNGDRKRAYQLGLQIAPTQGSGAQAALNILYNDPYHGLDDWKLNLALNGHWRLWDNGLFSASGQLTLSQNSSGVLFSNDRYTLDFTQSWSWGRFSAKLQNLDVLSQSQTTQSLLPELTLTVPALDLGFLGDYQIVLDYQNRYLTEPGKDLDGQRLALDITRAPTNLGKFGPFSIDAWAWGKVRLYDSGELVWSAGPALTLNAALTPSFRLAADFSWTFGEGTPPPLFIGDLYYPRGAVNLDAYYTEGPWDAKLSTSYSLTTGLWQPIAANLRWTSSSGDRLAFSTSYDPQTGLFGQTTFSLGWQPSENWLLTANAGYNPYTNLWTQLDFSASVKQKLSDTLTLDLMLRYNLSNLGWMQSYIGLAYIWHCRTVTMGYDWMKGEISLSIAINAFPSNPLQAGFSENGFWLVPPFELP